MKLSNALTNCVTFANVSVSDYQNSVSEIDKCTIHVQGKSMLRLRVFQHNLLCAMA